MSEMESKNPGEPLRLSRERLGLSINDVSVATKINPRILKALEDGNKAGLPPNSFTRGFIRSYAAYLKIDSKAILQAFDLSGVVMIPTSAASSASDSMGESSTSQNRPAKPYTNMRPVGDSSWTSKALVVGGMLVLALLIFGIKKVVDRYAHERVIEPKIVVPAPENTEDLAEEPDDTDEIAADGVALPGETTNVAAPSSPAITNIAPLTQENKLADEKALAEAKIVADKKIAAEISAAEEKKIGERKAAEKTTEKTTEKIAEKTGEKNTDAKPKVLKTIPQEVIIEALDTVELTIQVDGEAPKKIKLAPESLHTVKAKHDISIEVSDGGMVNIVYNGHDRGVPGDLGKPAKIKYP